MWLTEYHRRLGIGREPGATQPPLYKGQRGYTVAFEATTDYPEDMAKRIDFLDRSIAHLITLGAQPLQAAYVMAEAIPLLMAGRPASLTVPEATAHLLTYLPHLLNRTNLQDAVNAITRQAGVDYTTDSQWLLQKYNVLWIADYAMQTALIAREAAAEAARLQAEGDERAIQAATWEAEAYAQAQAAETARLAEEAELLRLAEVARIQAEEEAARQAALAQAAEAEQLRLQAEADAARIAEEEAEALRLESEAELAKKAAEEAALASELAAAEAQAIADQQTALTQAEASQTTSREDTLSLQTLLAVDQALKTGDGSLPVVELPAPGEEKVLISRETMTSPRKKVPFWVYLLVGAGAYYLMSDSSEKKSNA